MPTLVHDLTLRWLRWAGVRDLPASLSGVPSRPTHHHGAEHVSSHLFSLLERHENQQKLDTELSV